MTMPVFTLKAKDDLALPTMRDYWHRCQRAGLTEQAAEVQKAIIEAFNWRSAHREQCQLPDHKHVPVSEAPQ
jgi:hypothetical protein